MANKSFARKFKSSATLPHKFVEAEFWKEITSGRSSSIEYGCDIEGSAFSNSSVDPLATSKWNLKVHIWLGHQSASWHVLGSCFLDFSIIDVGKSQKMLPTWVYVDFLPWFVVIDLWQVLPRLSNSTLRLLETSIPVWSQSQPLFHCLWWLLSSNLISKGRMCWEYCLKGASTYCFMVHLDHNLV